MDIDITRKVYMTYHLLIVKVLKMQASPKSTIPEDTRSLMQAYAAAFNTLVTTFNANPQATSTIKNINAVDGDMDRRNLDDVYRSLQTAYNTNRSDIDRIKKAAELVGGYVSIDWRLDNEPSLTRNFTEDESDGAFAESDPLNNPPHP